MPYATGVRGTFSINSQTVGGMGRWEAEVKETKKVDNAGQGDSWDSSVHLRDGWTAKGEMEVPLVGAATYMALVGGATVDFVGQIDTEDGPFFTGPCRVTMAGISVTYDEKVKTPVEVEGQGEPTLIT